MHLIFKLSGLLCLALMGVNAQGVQYPCPLSDLACHDVIDSSQCIEQLVLEHNAPITKAALVKCVEYDGAASKLPGATKLCRCSGCHTQPINDEITQLFPPPCS
ncbi:hypothetical protein B0T19DRAFT_231586 [Cercophora scortea]|uniref:Uncharacterized protein n=1 Tax=Cercophora scortea TaxID=314031 RepID=A0AAE0M9L6_9PEZI|nr:hypothetical protein B0T19DRAFT_231586 [Cercophora scortea]